MIKKADELRDLVRARRALPVEVQLHTLTIAQLTKALGDHWLATHPELNTTAMQVRRALGEPMQCYDYRQLKPLDKSHLWNSPEWIAEIKYDGVRLIPVYTPMDGLRFFSRHLSTETFLPIDYTANLVLFKGGDRTVAYTGFDLVGCFQRCFVLDCEGLVLNPTMMRSQDGVTMKTGLQAICALCGLEAEKARWWQTTGGIEVEFRVLDLIEIWFRMAPMLVYKEPLRRRRELLATFMQQVLTEVLPQFKQSEAFAGKKIDFFQKIIDNGGEGVVLKNLNRPYVTTGGRDRKTIVKVKRDMVRASGTEIDAFVIGHTDATDNKAFRVAGCIAGLKLGVWLVDKDGVETLHHIASVSGMPMAIRKMMSLRGKKGQPHLNPVYMNQVLVINGQDISPKNKRFTHATIDWQRGFRTDKPACECKLTEEFLDSQTL